MSDERQEITPEQFEVQKAVLGIDAETFRRTNLGRYVYDRAAMEEEKLIENLIEKASGSPDKDVCNLALRIQMQRMLPRYLDEAIGAGHAAENTIDQMEAHQEYQD